MTVYAADFESRVCSLRDPPVVLDTATLMAAGFVGAVRYVTGPGAVTDEEFFELTHTPGFALALVMETVAQSAQGGFDVGRREATRAFTRADELGWPNSRPIYFVGEDPEEVDPSRWPAIARYFEGVLSVAPVSRVGDYGSPRQIDHMMGLGLATWGWAVETWHGDPASCHIRQMANPVPGGPSRMSGCVDVDIILKPDWGQWSAVTPVPSAMSMSLSSQFTPPIPAESEHMIVTDDFRANQLDTFHVDDEGRLVHFWFSEPGPWHGEVLAAGAKPAGRIAYKRWAGDGMAHVFVEKQGGGQIHRFWNGSVWGSDEQPGPIGGSVLG